MDNYRKLLGFLHGNKRILAVAVVLMLFASFFEVFQIGLVAPMVDIVFNGRSIEFPHDLPGPLERLIEWVNNVPQEQMFWTLPIVLVIGIILKQFFIFAYQYYMNDVSERILREIRDRLFSKLTHLSMDFYSQRRAGELASRITYDVQTIGNALSYAITDYFKQTFLLIMFVTTAFLFYPQAAAILFIGIPLLALPLRNIGRRLKKLTRFSQEKMADINSMLLETIGGIKLVKAFDNEEYENRRFKEHNFQFYRFSMKAIKRLIIISPITEIFGALCGIAIFYIIGKQVMDDQLSFGVVGVFMGSVLSVISPVKKLGNANAITQRALAASERIYEILDAQQTVVEKAGALDIGELRDAIRLNGVSFRYLQEDGDVLKHIDLEIKKGELVAIVGPTGSGKSTLINLLARFYDPQLGSVTLDGADLKDCTFSSLRKQIGIVTQESILFNDTVRANICYGKMDATIEEVEEAARKAFAHQFIVKMPKGYDTQIGDRGFRLSGGEKQRISIARAILKNAPILILDEATSALDSESERFVQEALDKLMLGRTVIAIAHRLSTIKKADKIVVLENGTIIGKGRHEDLLKSCPLYEKLHSMQFQV